MAEECLDHKLCEEMAEYVEKITLSGEHTLHVESMKKFKKICRISDLYVKHAYHMLMSTLEKNHAEIRLSAVKIIDELFNRSHSFRELLVSDFQRFLELTVETDHDQPLPPPSFAAKKLRAETLKFLQQWHEKYGDAYKKLVLGYNFLQSCKLVDFNDIRTRTIAERMREEEKERKRKRILEQKLRKVLEETSECVPEIETCKIEIENCLNLLLPRPEDFYIGETDSFFDSSDFSHSSEIQLNNSKNQSQTQIEVTNINIKENSCPLGENDTPTCDTVGTDTKDSKTVEENSDSDSCNGMEAEDFINDYGLGSRKYNLNIEICPKKLLIEETEDNKDIFKTLRDSIKMMKEKFSPKILRWLEIMTKAGAEEAQIKEIIDLKSAVDMILNKCVEMKVTEACDVDMESDDQDDFEDVPEKEGYEAEVPFHLLTATEMGLKEGIKNKRRGRNEKTTNQNWSIKSESVNLKDPTTRAANLSKLGLFDTNGASTSTSDHCSHTKTGGGSQVERAPVVPFGPDLANWEHPEKLEKPMTIKYDSLHRFWTPAEHENELATQHDVEALTSRTFHYTGNFKPVQWTCRAPLPSGALCERRDRLKCPFHGKIIGRDETGKPSNIEDAKRLLAEQAKKFRDAEPNWQDAELQRDIELSLGIDLGSKSAAAKSNGKGKGKGKGKNKKYENLTDINDIKNTSRSRLEKRIFNKSSMKRVTSRLDAADFKRVQDKFANQFNYAHSQ